MPSARSTRSKSDFEQQEYVKKMINNFNSIQINKWKKTSFKELTWNYLVVGDREETLIMFPGGLRRPVYGGVLVQELSKEFRVLIPVYPQISDMKALADGVSWIMKQEDIKSAHLFGSSFGGLMTQAFLYYYPNKVNKVIIGNSGTISHDKSYKKKINSLLFFIKILPAFFVRRVMIRVFTNLVPPNIENRIEIVSVIQDVVKSKQLDKNDIICHFESLSFFQNELGLTQAFTSTIQHEILVISSENDRGVSPGALKSLKKMYPRAQFHHFLEGGHMPMLAYPLEYINLVKSFLLN